MADQSPLMKYLPLLVIAGGLVASGSVSQFQIAAHAEELADIGTSVDENEEAIEHIQRLLIQRQGQVELDLQLLETELKGQGEDLDDILLLLQQLQMQLRGNGQ